ncbi:MAG: hypothetical protein Q9181_004086 [Wetmoreana brouardii]
MGYPPEMMDTVNGMAPQYSPNDYRQGVDPRYETPMSSAYGGPPVYQMPASQAGYLPTIYPQLPPTPMISNRLQTSPFTNLQNALSPRSSGVAVVIPSPAPSHTQGQRTPSLPNISRQPMRTTQRVVSTPLTVSKSAAPGHEAGEIPPVDYQLVLLSLAEDYLAAAHSQASVREQEIDWQHHKLLGAGLGCLEIVLKRFKLQPLMEATVRLRYASVLYEETENVLEAEQTLSDGIKLCDRYRLFDQKYNMEHLLARVLFNGSPRASLKFLDGVIKDAEAYQHTAWVYALRFLKLSLLLRLSSHQDTVSAYTQLKSISALADRLGDKAVLGLASTLEALIHLQESSSAESIEQAQRALAMARSQQFDPKVGQISQIVALTNIVDLCCTLQHFDPSQAVAKMQAMQASLESPDDTWQEDGSLLIPVHSQEASRAFNGSGVVRKDSNGSLSIVFSWTPRSEIHALGYLLSSIAIAHRNTSDGLRSEQMLREGMRCLDKNTEKHDSVLEPNLTVSSRHIWRQNLRCFFELHVVFALCTRTAWSTAQKHFQELKESIRRIAQKPGLLELYTQFLNSIIHQGTGDLDAALSIFQSSCFSITNPITCSPAHLDLAILSTFNSILIVRTPFHPSHHLLPSLLSSVEPYLPRIKSSKCLSSAYNLILATSPHPTPTIVKTKQYLQLALQAAKSAQNNQLVCITLNFMSYKFFKGVVGEQAEKSARASENLARKGMDALWQSVSAGLVADTLEMAGKGEEAERMRRVGREIARGLPEGVVMWEDKEGEEGDVEMR